MKTAELSDIWDFLRRSAPLASRGYRMKQCGSSRHTRCYAAVTLPDGRAAFVVEIDAEEPKLRFAALSTRAFTVDYGAAEGLSPDSVALILTLQDPALSDIFSILCVELDIAARSAPNATAVPRDLATVLERWRAFFQRRSALLTNEEVRGLIGELVTLARLINLVGAEAAVSAWKGPIGGVRDFESDLVHAETKTFAPSAGVSVYVSDPLQLEAPTGFRLKLVCVALDQSPSGATLLDYVLAVESLLQSDPAILGLFRQRVANAGFLPCMADAFAEKFVAFEPRVFEVREGFPRIRPESIPAGVRSVRFAIELAGLGAFAMPADSSIGGRSQPLHPVPLP